MCLFKNCSGQKAHPVQWGLKHKLCQPHYQQIVDRLTDGGKLAISADYLSDYVGLKAMMIEMETVMTQLTLLAKEIDAAIQLQQQTPDDDDDRFRAERASDLDYIRISRVLENYEGYCWFPPCHRIFVGGLSGPDFYWYLAHGYMVKDPGPNINHGDFTHRYQWHAIMRHLTNNFKNSSPTMGWNHTPLELYVSLGAAQARNANVWGKVLDRDGASAADIVSYETFSEPNTLHKRLREGEYRRLTLNTVRRFDKRRTALEAARDLIKKYAAKNATEYQKWWSGQTVPEDFEVAGLLYAWRKNGGRAIGIETDVPALAPKAIDESSKDFSDRQKGWRARMKLVHAADVIEDQLGHSVNSSKRFKRYAYKPGMPHYSFIITPESLNGFVVLAEKLENGKMEGVSEKEINQRVGQSKGGFDITHYQYGKGGVKKIKETELSYI